MLDRLDCREISQTSQDGKGCLLLSRMSHDLQPLVSAAKHAYFHSPDKQLQWLLEPRKYAYILWNLRCNNRVNMKHSQQNKHRLHKTSLGK